VGEIADALRRARSGGLLGLGRPEGSRARPAEHDPRPGEAAAVAAPAAPLTLQATHPTDPAIVHAPSSEIEACRQLALRLRIELERRRARSVALVSALRDEGKTTTSCNLALALASLSTGRSVALLDLDMRKPSIARVLGIEAEVGVESFLAGEVSLDQVRVATSHSALDIYPAVKPQRSAHEMLAGREFSEMIAELERRYEVVLVDTPPTLLVPDARLILRHVAVCVPVARASSTRVRAFRELIGALPREQILGTLLNGKRGRGHYYQEYEYTDAGGAGDGSPRRRAPRRRLRTPRVEAPTG